MRLNGGHPLISIPLLSGKKIQENEFLSFCRAHFYGARVDQLFFIASEKLNIEILSKLKKVAFNIIYNLTY